MTDLHNAELSTKALVRITIATLVSALLALFLFVLPAEFDTDPTGVGELLGIKGMAKQRSVIDPSKYIRKRALSIADGAATILKDDRSDCFTD